jgi:hypothetical protein
MSDNAHVSSEHSDQQECDHVFTRATDSDGDNMTASADSDTDSERGGL